MSRFDIERPDRDYPDYERRMEWERWDEDTYELIEYEDEEEEEEWLDDDDIDEL